MEVLSHILHYWYSHYLNMATLEPGRLQNVGKVRVPSNVECPSPLVIVCLMCLLKQGWGSGNTPVHASMRLTVQSPNNNLVRSGQRSQDLPQAAHTANGRLHGATKYSYLGLQLVLR